MYHRLTINVRHCRNLSSSVPHGVKHVGVLGAGQMGSGIAQVAAQSANLKVSLFDISAAQLKKSMGLMEKLLSKGVANGKLTQETMVSTLANITTTTDRSALASADFIIEAVSENESVKLNIFKEVCKETRENTILASNTSSISITKIAAATSRPDSVIGMHFMNPVPVMKLVEIIPGLQTSESTLQRTLALATAMNKTTTKSNDMPGFIANRILMPYINEAIQCLAEGTGTATDIDTTMKLGTNVPMGPLTLADFIGLDTCLAIMQVLHKGLGDDKYRASPLLIKMVDAGWLGKKTGRGFYTYETK